LAVRWGARPAHRPAAMPLEEEEQIDDMTIGLQMMQFLDEWHYRVLHANMATVWDRTQTVVATLDLFEAHGLVFAPDEKWELAAMEEDKMVEALVHKMSPQLRRSFEHFTLQLQLIVSTATRVRVALDEGDSKDVQRIVEDGDKGIMQQILKATVVEAAAEVGELRLVHGSWAKSMGRRVDRLARTAQSTEAARWELEQIEASIDQYKIEQNAKSQKVLMTMCSGNSKMLVKTTFGGWWALTLKNRSERHIHERFKKEIADAEAKLLEFKMAQSASIKKVLMKSVADSASALTSAAFDAWLQLLRDGKEEGSNKDKLARQKERLQQLQEAQKASAKRTMARMAEGSDESLRSMSFHGWATYVQDTKHANAVHEKSAAIQKQIEAMKSRSSDQSKSVLESMAATSDIDLLVGCFHAWADDAATERKAREVEEVIANSNQKFAMLRNAQKAKATDVKQQAIDLQKENTKMQIFMNWSLLARGNYVHRHYAGKMDSKKQQLEAVRTMFNKFATELGDISNTPRKHGHSHKRVKGESKAALPNQSAPQAAPGNAG